ncbi:MAG: DUF4416 family protein [Endomicrobia bacterium]|nr:DUF4416 family protein [Endomicrobiia bacterium]MDW8056380.1 DUF4416 family protein [Elusimicrobiota bacterium]
MGEIKTDYKIKLICGMLFNPQWCTDKFGTDNYATLTKKINKMLEQNFTNFFGVNFEVDNQSELIKFDFTDYYNDEMGEEILRYWVSFRPTIVQPRQIYKVKYLTNELEQKFFCDNNGRRKVNLDPGYIEGSKLILFSTKNYSHRIYLGEGIFAEVTLIYKHRKFEILPWTYPDYKTEAALNFFSTVRDKWCEEQNSV